MAIYENIRKVATEKGYSINRLEKELGLPRGSILKYNKSTPGSDKLQKIAEFLGCSVDLLLNGETSEGYYYDAETAALAQEIYQNPELHMLLDAARDSSASDIKAFYDMVLLMKRRERHEE